jgi:ABC-2 type transport system permease protein
MRGLWRLTWLEIKIFVREPLGVLGTVGIPVILFVVLARLAGGRGAAAADADTSASVDVPVFAALLIAISVVLSLVTIISIYREGGILKRLRATPLRPHTILTAHVLVKLLSTAATLGLMVLAGRRTMVFDAGVPLLSFAAALLFCTICLISLGFLIASVVPTARFAQPIGSLLLYPMLGVSGLFVPLEALPGTVQTVARALPFTYAASLLKGIWRGEGWTSHIGDAAVLAGMLVVLTVVSSRVFRWE